MADRLAKVYGTEMDKVNCPFFYKIGACRYGDSCERIHNKPPISETVCLQHMYENNAIQTALIDGHNVSSADAEAAMTKFQNFFEQVFKEMMKYGEIQDMIVVDNLGDHIVGNIYVKYSQEQYSQNAQKNINGRFFNGKKIDAQFSPVTDFLNAKCKQYIDGSCKRGGYCNYMHIKPLSKSFKRELFTQMYLQFPEYRDKKADSDSSSEGDWKKSQNKDKRQRKHKSKKDRSRSREKKQKKQKKKRKRSSSQSSKNSQQIMEQIAKWNKQFYDQ